MISYPVSNRDELIAAIRRAPEGAKFLIPGPDGVMVPLARVLVGGYTADPADDEAQNVFVGPTYPAVALLPFDPDETVDLDPAATADAFRVG